MYGADLAWAVSVHKAQGMTVDHGIVDVKNAFEFGQIYGNYRVFFYLLLLVIGWIEDADTFPSIQQ